MRDMNITTTSFSIIVKEGNFYIIYNTSQIYLICTPNEIDELIPTLEFAIRMMRTGE